MRGPRLLALVGAFRGDDAVGTDLGGLLEALRAAGWDAAAWAERVDTVHAPLVAPDPEERLEDSGCVVLLDHAFLWREGERLLARARGPRVLRYHGGPTPRHYRDHPGPYAQQIAGTWRQTRRIAPAFDRVLAVSTFAARRLWRLGVPAGRLRVVPPFLRLEALRDAAPDPALAARLSGERRPVVLTVGRVAAQKRQEAVVRLAERARARVPAASIAFRIVGGDEADGYGAHLDRLLQGLGAGGSGGPAVERWPSTGVAGLRAHLAAASALLVTSRSEGFCVPVVEAQALGVPVLAGRVDAVPETAGAGALLVADVETGKGLEALLRLLGEPDLRARLVAAGHANAERFARPRTAARLLAALEGVLHGPRARLRAPTPSHPLGEGARRAVRWLRWLRGPPRAFS